MPSGANATEALGTRARLSYLRCAVGGGGARGVKCQERMGQAGRTVPAPEGPLDPWTCSRQGPAGSPDLHPHASPSFRSPHGAALLSTEEPSTLAKLEVGKGWSLSPLCRPLLPFSPRAACVPSPTLQGLVHTVALSQYLLKEGTHGFNNGHERAVPALSPAASAS